MTGKDLEIRCPECGLRIRLDPRTGSVIAHDRDERPRDLGEATRQHEDRMTAKDQAFHSAMAAEKGRKQELEDLFREAAEKAKKDDAGKKPDQPLDDRWR